MKDTIINIELITDESFQPVVQTVLTRFLDNRAKIRSWDNRFLKINRVFTRGNTGSAVISVSYGCDRDGSSLDHVFRVLKIGEASLLLQERDGFDRFNNKGSAYFSRLVHNTEDIVEIGNTVYTVLEYDDAQINSSAQSLKELSKYVIEYYYESKKGAGYDPNPIAENIGNVLYRMFLDLKNKVYGAGPCDPDHCVENDGTEMPLNEILYRKLDRSINDEIYNALEGETLTGITRNECLAHILDSGPFYIANHIHGDMNPGNVLLCIDVNGRDIDTCRLIDYGEVISKKNEGFTFVFWDIARLTGEFVLDFVDHVVKTDREVSWDTAVTAVSGVIKGIFGEGDEDDLAGIWDFLRHILFAVIESFFGLTGEISEHTFRSNEALNDYLRFLMAFMFFFLKYKKEDVEKRRCALHLFSVLMRVRDNAGITQLADKIELLRGEIITRRDSQRRYDILKSTKFSHINISDRILSGFTRIDAENSMSFNINVENQAGDKYRLYNIVMNMKEEQNRLLLLTGDGGMGKTTALFHLFEELSRRSGPVPIYLELQWINNASGDELTDNWIIDHILEVYASKRVTGNTALTKEDKREQVRSLFRRNEQSPRYLLMLDGFNEVTKNRDSLLRSLQVFNDSFTNVMVIAASRPLGNDAQHFFPGYAHLSLVGVSESDIRSYLSIPQVLDVALFESCTIEEKDLIEKWYHKEHDILKLRKGYYDLHPELIAASIGEKGASVEYPSNSLLSELIKNPFFLCLYAGTESERNIKHDGSFSHQFIDECETPSELLYNFFVSAGIKWKRAYTDTKQSWKEEELRYYLELVLPYIAYNMQQKNTFSIHEEDVLDCIGESLKPLNDENFLDDNGYNAGFSLIKKEISREYMIRESRFPYYVMNDALSVQLAVLVRSDETGNFEFAHQYFRDYFAALHVRNSIDALLQNKIIVRYFRENREGFLAERSELLLHDLKMLHDIQQEDLLLESLGNLYGEHKKRIVYKNGAFDDSHYYESFEENKTGLDQLLDVCRGIFDKGVIGYIVKNIIRTFVITKKDLSLYDFRDLQLDGINLNNVRLGRGRGKGGADFRGAALSLDDTLYSSGHSMPITHYAVSPFTGELATYSKRDRVLMRSRGDKKHRQVLEKDEMQSVVGIRYISPFVLRVYFYDSTYSDIHAPETPEGEINSFTPVDEGLCSFIWQGEERFYLGGSEGVQEIPRRNFWEQRKSNPVTVSAISPDGMFKLMYSEKDKCLTVYDLLDVVISHEMEEHVTGIAISGDYIVIAFDDCVEVHSIQDFKHSYHVIVSMTFFAPVSDMVWLAGGDVALILEKKRIVVWRPFEDNSALTFYSSSNGTFHDLSVDTTGRIMFFRQMVNDFYGIIWSYSIDTRRDTMLNNWSDVRVTVMRSLNNNVVFIGNTVGDIYLYDCSTGQVLQSFEGHFGMVTGLTISKDRSRVLSCGDDGFLLESSVDDGVLLNNRHIHNGVVWDVAYGVDDISFTVCCDDGRIVRFAGANDEEGTLLACNPFASWCCSYDSGGTLYYSCMKTLYRLDLSGNSVPVVTLDDDAIVRFEIDEGKGIIRGFGFNQYYFEADPVAGEVITEKRGIAMYREGASPLVMARCHIHDEYIMDRITGRKLTMRGGILISGAVFDSVGEDDDMLNSFGAHIAGNITEEIPDDENDLLDSIFWYVGGHTHDPDIPYTLLHETKIIREHDRISILLGKKFIELTKDVSAAIPTGDGHENAFEYLVSTLHLHNEKEIADFHELIKSYLIIHLKRKAIMEYLIMQKSGNYGAYGKERVLISFCRNLLYIPPDIEVTQDHADIFTYIIDGTDRLFSSGSYDFFKCLYEQYSYNMLGHNETANKSLVDYIKNIKFPFHYDCRVIDRFTHQMILGKLNHFQSNEAKVIIFEYIRNPMDILAFASVGSNVRYESCLTIFSNKWMGFFSQSMIEKKINYNHPNTSINEGLKEFTLSYYNVSSREEMLSIKEVFVNDMIDGILHHQLGVKDSKKDLHVYYEMQTPWIDTPHLSETLTEVLYDWGTDGEEVKRSVSRFCEIADNDIYRAAGCVYAYLSDNWFIDDTDTTYYLLRTEILHGLMLMHIDEKGAINFESVKQSIPEYRLFARSFLVEYLDEILDIARNGIYHVGELEMTYEMLVDAALDLYRESAVNISTREELFLNGKYWINFWGYVEKFSPETHALIQDYTSECEDRLRREVLAMITPEPKKYNYSLLEYIYARYREIGILKERPVIEYIPIVEELSTSLDMKEEERLLVYGRFQEIMENSVEYDISISYEGEPDPFITIIQEIMLKTGLGDLMAGLDLGELYDPEEPIEQRIKYIKDELEGIRNRIESEMYLDIELLQINNQYGITSFIEDCLENIWFLDNTLLKDKIKNVESVDFEDMPVMRAYISLKKGYMDWNTAQAVWRINQELRPEEFITLWTIDRDFLECLFEIAANDRDAISN